MRENSEGGRRSGQLDVRNSYLPLIQTLGATFTMDADMPSVLFLDPGGAGRNVLLPPEASGLWFIVRNTADAAETLTFKEDAGSTTILALGQGATGLFFCDGTTWYGTSTGSIGATAAEIDRVADVSARLVAGGSELSVTQALHDGKTLLFDTAAGTTFTLPTASGSGARFRFVVSVTATSNSHKIQAGAAADIFYGGILSADVDTSDATLFWAAEAADAFDTITFNRTTTGLAAIGDWIELEDIGTNKWAVHGAIRANGAVATPFSSAV